MHVGKNDVSTSDSAHAGSRQQSSSVGFTSDLTPQSQRGTLCNLSASSLWLQSQTHSFHPAHVDTALPPSKPTMSLAASHTLYHMVSPSTSLSVSLFQLPLPCYQSLPSNSPRRLFRSDNTQATTTPPPHSTCPPPRRLLLLALPFLRLSSLFVSLVTWPTDI